MGYERVHKNDSSRSPSFYNGYDQKKSKVESFGVQPKPDTHATVPHVSKSYSSYAADLILAKMTRGLNAKTENQSSQTPEHQLEPETKSSKVSSERGSVSGQGESGDEDGNSNSRGTNPIQPKLTIGTPGDKYEQEADSIAAKVMSTDIPTRYPIIQPRSIESVQRLPRPVFTTLRRQPQQPEIPVKSSPATPDLETRLSSQKGGGNPLDEQTRSFMEPRFGSDFSSVRVHTDSSSVQMNKELGAQAFAHGSDIFFGAGKTPGQNELTAHELTHVVQQGGAARMNPEPIRAKKLINYEVPANFNQEHHQPKLEPIQAKQLPSEATSLINNKEVHHFPLESEQPLQAKQLSDSIDSSDSNKEKHTFLQQDVNSVPTKHISTLSVSPRIQGGWFDWLENGKRTLIEEAAKTLQNIPGYDLLVLALGQNPITGQAVERNATNAVGAFLKLVPGGEKIFENLKQSGELEKAFTWWQGEITKLNITVENIKGLVKQAIDSIGLSDAIYVSKAIERIKGIFTPTIDRIKTFASNVTNKVVEITLEGFMKGAGGYVSRVMDILKKAGNVFGTIASDPIKFCGNLVKAVTGGFSQFQNNFGQHFQNGMIKWLFGTLATTGITVPSEFNAESLISIALETLGITYQHIRPKLVQAIGGDEKKLAKAEQGVDILQKMLQGGLGKAWQEISELMENLQQHKDEMMQDLQKMVIETVISAAIPKLLSLFIPGAGIIQAAMSVYNTIVFFIEKAQEIGELANAVFDSIGNIASGNLAAASNLVETVMGRSVSLIIGFLARLIGIGNLSDKVRKLIEKIKDKIDKALDKLVQSIAGKVKVFISQNPTIAAITSGGKLESNLKLKMVKHIHYFSMVKIIPLN